MISIVYCLFVAFFFFPFFVAFFFSSKNNIYFFIKSKQIEFIVIAYHKDHLLSYPANISQSPVTVVSFIK